MGEEQATPSEVWVIDTCSVIHVRRIVQTGRQPAVYNKLTEMVEAGSLVFPTQVFDELHRNAGSGKEDRPFDWAKRNKAQACTHGTDYQKAALVLSEVPEVLDPDKPSGQDEADPYVLALALQLQEDGMDVTVITEERNDKPKKLSLNTACGLLKIPCVPIAPFLGRRGIWKPPPR